MIKTTLFELANAADTIFIVGEKAKEIDFDDYFGGEQLLRLTVSDDVEYFFADQEVEMNDQGEVRALESIEGMEDEDEEEKDKHPIRYYMRFLIERPVTLDDLNQG